MTYYMYFIQTFIIRCIVSEILAEIDHKGPNWTFLTLIMTFRVIPYLSYFRAGLVSQHKRPPGLIAPLLRFWHLLGNPPKNTTKGRDLIFNEGIRLLNMADTSLDRFT